MNEIWFGLTLAVNALLLVGAWRFVRRFVDDPWDAAADAVLLWYLVQYAVVAGLGVSSVLSGATILAGGGLVGAALLSFGRSRPRAEKVDWVPVLATCFVVSYLIAIIWISRYAPPIANDALAYHLSAPVQWLQTGRLGLFHTWFYNPANSYSPLAGSTFICWLMGPLGNDSLARFMQSPTVVLLFFACLRLSRAFGASLWVAAILAVAAAMSRPFLSQTVLAKDDVPLAALFVMGVSSFSRKALNDPLGPWRLGVAWGLFFAMKYTAMLSTPVLLLAIDAPWRAGWRWKKHLIAIAIVALLAGPWYVRNWVLTGNPIYPTGVSLLGMQLFRGGLLMLHSDRLTSWDHAWNTITNSYYSPPPTMAILGSLVWLVAIALSARKLLRDPLLRSCLIGAPIVIALFVLKSPYGEVRLIGPVFAIFPSMAALFPLNCIPAIALAAVTLSTGFQSERLRDLSLPTGLAMAAVTAIVAGWLYTRAVGRLLIASAVAMLLAGCIYVNWVSYRTTCDVSASQFWEDPHCYGEYAQAWSWIRQNTPSGCTIAYDNFFLVYPLFGSDLSRHVVYVPSRPGVHEVNDLPFMGPIIGEQVPVEVVRVMGEGADRETWMKNLAASGAKYLLIGKEDLTHPDLRVNPREIDFVAAAPDRFRPLKLMNTFDLFEVLP